MATTKKLTGPEKAAIFLMSMGEEKAAQIMAEMEEREIQSMGNYISAVGDVETADVDQVTREFFTNITSGIGGGLGINSLDFLKAVLMRALPHDKAQEILSNVTTPGEDLGGGLDTIRQLEPKLVAQFLANEHPQTAAIVLAHLDAPIASATLKELPNEMQTEVVYRLATLERVAPQVIRDLDEALQAEFRTSGAISGSKMGGLDTCVQVISELDRATETALLTNLDEVDPELANEIRNLRFTYEDMLKLDDNGVQLVLKEVNSEDLLISLKTGSDEVKDKVFSNMSDRAGSMLKEDLEALGPTRITEVEKAQQKVVQVIKRLEEEGKLVIGGGGEELV